MAINYATKYAEKIAERFHLNSITDDDCGKDYTFLDPDSRTIRVGSVDVVPESQYKREGDDRFGPTYDLGDTLQEMTCDQCPAFSIALDRVIQSDQAIKKEAGKVVRRQLDEVTIPGVDKHRIKSWALGANIVHKLSAAPTKNNIVETIMDLGVAMDNAGVPSGKRTLYIAASYYKLVKLSNEFISLKDLGESSVGRGVVGELDGMRVKKVPDHYMPKGIYFYIKHKGCTVDPVKLQQVDILEKVKGIAGSVIQGVTYHGAFVIGAKGDGIAVAGSADAVLDAPAITVSASSHAATITAVSGVVFKYTTDGSNPRYSTTAQVYTAAVTLKEGETIKAVGTKDGCIGIAAEAEYK